MRKVYLSERQAQVKEYFDQGMTRREIATKLGVTYSRIYQILRGIAYKTQARGSMDVRAYMSTRLSNAIYDRGFTFSDTLGMSDSELLGIKNFGVRTLKELRVLQIKYLNNVLWEVQ